MWDRIGCCLALGIVAGVSASNGINQRRLAPQAGLSHALEAREGYADPKKFKLSSCCLDKQLIHGPLLDQVLAQEKCRPKWTSEDICEIATKLYGKEYESCLYPTVPEDGLPLAEKSREKHGEQYTVNYPADLAIIGQGKCYNVIPHVQPGDSLDSFCDNEKVSALSLTELLSIYQFYVAGDLDIRISQSGQGIIAIGGDLRRAGSTVASDSPRGGHLGQFATWIGGDVWVSDVMVDLTEPIGLGGEDLNAVDAEGGAQVGGYTHLTPEEVNEGRLIIQSKVCALSQSLFQAGTDEGVIGTVTIGEPTGNPPIVTIDIVCKNTQTCVVEFEYPSLPDGGVQINIQGLGMLSKLEQLIINVGGESIYSPDWSISSATLDAIAAMTTPLGMVWNFYEALDIHITHMDWYGSVVAPVAKTVTFFAPAPEGKWYGGVYLGHAGSLLRFYPFPSLIDMHPSLLPIYLPFPPSKIVLCDCLCKDDGHKAHRVGSSVSY